MPRGLWKCCASVTYCPAIVVGTSNDLALPKRYNDILPAERPEQNGNYKKSRKVFSYQIRCGNAATSSGVSRIRWIK